MLAVFHPSVVKGPEELCPSDAADSSNLKPGVGIISAFRGVFGGSVCVHFDESSAILYTEEQQNDFKPRSFAVVDGIFCCFIGTLENLPSLRQQYGLSKSITEVLQMIEMYRTLRDRGPYPTDQVIGALCGSFAFVLFDNHTKTLLVSNDDKGKVQLFWGLAEDGSLAFSDTPKFLKDGCGKSFAPFPPGCFFSTKEGLSSFQHPLNKLKAMPRIDSQGQVCGCTFKVDQAKKESPRGIPRVGSDATWGATSC